VRITADSEQALNVGQLISDSGRIGMFGALVARAAWWKRTARGRRERRDPSVATKDLTLDAGRGPRQTARAAATSFCRRKAAPA